VKNQSDLIVTIVAVLCMLIGLGVTFGTRKEAVKPAAPEAVNLSQVQLPAANVVMATSLPNAGSSSGGATGSPVGSPVGGGGRAGGAPMMSGGSSAPGGGPAASSLSIGPGAG
jgi:hypothetical protein